MFYYYNGLDELGIGRHEGDWEMVQIVAANPTLRRGVGGYVPPANAIASIGVLCIAVIGLAGCGSDGGRPSRGGSDDSAARPRPASPDKPGRDSTPGGDRFAGAGIRKGSKIVKRGGATIILPPKPSAYRLAPQRACRDAGSPGASVPPAPGLSARRRAEGAVALRYRVTKPRGCEPVQVRLTLDVNDDGNPGMLRGFRLPSAKRSDEVVIMPQLRRRPDVAKASVVTGQGVRSDVIAVRIR